jgi:hypothetical protein
MVQPVGVSPNIHAAYLEPSLAAMQQWQQPWLLCSFGKQFGPPWTNIDPLL